ncbi:hypothetical protein [Thiomicrorhabdus chilensis]|uniref:hypothetical protein n=1 Tax=Thiomicrorhabdus chilensis TaxID=63656 RepID=UPI000423D1DF|nr:hypothetical protein [Thiomicrorhabdus chilensis]
MKTYILFILLQSGNMHSMEFATYNDCATAQSQLQTVIEKQQGHAQCLLKGSVVSDSLDKTKQALADWLTQQSDK